MAPWVISHSIKMPYNPKLHINHINLILEHSFVFLIMNNLYILKHQCLEVVSFPFTARPPENLHGCGISSGLFNNDNRLQPSRIEVKDYAWVGIIN